MKILLAFLYVFSSITVVLADIPPTAGENKPQDSGICAGVLLLTAAIVILGRLLLKKTEMQKDE